MTEPTLSLLRNTFNNVTKSNYKRMILMSRDHHDKLKGFAASDATVNALYQQFLPAYTNFITLYDQVKSNYSMYQGYTKQFESYMEELRSTLIRKWDILIQVEYDQPTPQYTMLMANTRSVFQVGAYEMRLSAVNQLYNNLVVLNNPNLSNLITIIDNWRTSAQDARSQQQSYEAKDKDLRNQLETARQELAVEMYGVFYGLAAYYYKNPIKVESFYELQYLQSPNKSNSSSDNQNEAVIDANSQKTILSGDYTNQDTFNIENIGNTTLQTWISNDENSPIPFDAAFLNEGESINFLANELSDGSTPMKYLIIANTNSRNGKCRVVKLE